MTKEIREVQEPLNATERYLHGINIRLEVLIEQFGSLINHLAEKDGVAVTSHKVEEEIVKPVQVEEEVAKPVTRTRAVKKVTK